jgi:hypothetical protein
MATSSLPFRDRNASPLAVPHINTTNLQNHPAVSQDLPSVDYSTHQRSEGAVEVREQQERRRVTLVDAPPADNPNVPPPQYNQSARPQLKAPAISINGSRSESNMHHAFSLRRSRSGAKAKQADSLAAGHPPMHSRNHSMTYGDKNGGLAPSPSNAGGLSRSMSKREKFVRAFTNPDKIFDRDPTSPPPESRYVPFHMPCSALFVLRCCFRIPTLPLSPIMTLHAHPKLTHSQIQP